MFLLREWIETEESEKDVQWANQIISDIRMYMRPLVSREYAERGMDYLLGRQDMTPIMNLFQNPAALDLNNNSHGANFNSRLLDMNGNPMKKEDRDRKYEMTGLDWPSFPAMETIKNMLVAENKKMGVKVTAKSDDPTSTIKKKNDEAFIKNSAEIEGLFNYIYTSIGEAPYKIDDHESRFSEKPDNGNTQDFKRMGLDSSNPSDINFFMKHFHKLDCEIAAEAPINYCMRSNEVEDVFIENWVIDMTAKKAIAAQHYVSRVTGKITYNYLTPETTYVHGGGRRKDYDDANAKAYQQDITIKDLIDRVGNQIDLNRDMNALFQAIYTCSQGSIDITGINADSRNGWSCISRNGARYTYQNFMEFKVSFGYMEWITDTRSEDGNINQSGNVDFKTNRSDYTDNDLPGDKEDVANRYPKKARYEYPTYKAYYIVLSAYTQRIFDFGKVTYQSIEGYNDYNANWTILTYKEIGESIANNCATFVDQINECWYKIKFLIRKAKEPGTDFNYSSLLDIAENLYTDTNLSRADKVGKMISFLDSSANGIWTWPMIDGKYMAMPNTQMNVEKPNGPPAQIMVYWELILKTKELMMESVGLNAPLRQGDPGASRNSMNNEFKALEYSQNNTYYIPDSITYMCQKLAVRTMLQVEDIIQFKDYDTLAYKYLEDAVGEEKLSKIGQLGKKAMHRYGIFVESLNQTAQKQKLQGRIDLAIQNGKISNAEALLVEEIKSPKEAALILAYFEQRNVAIAQKNAMQLQQQQLQKQKDAIEGQKQLILLKGNIDLELARVTGSNDLQVHLATQEGQLTKQAMKQSGDVEQIYHQADADIQVARQNIDATGKSTVPPQQLQTPEATPGAPPQPMRPQSAIQQQLQTTHPMNTGAAM